MKDLIFSHLIAVAVFSSAAAAASINNFSDAPSRSDDLILEEGSCQSNCLMVFDYGNQKIWYYVDGKGELYLDYIENTSKSTSPPQNPVVLFSDISTPSNGTKSLNCGSDGWGWSSGASISSIHYPNGTWIATNYSHAGQAIRTTFNSNGTVQSSTNVSSGIRANTPSSCKSIRDSVQEK